MSEFTLLHGDCREVLRGMADESVQCVVTSPPYYGLRDYGVAGQIGLERTPQEYVAEMVEVFREVRRVLRRDGTLWLNIGDSYAGSGKGTGDTKTTNKPNGASRGVRIGSVHGESGHTSGVTPPPGFKAKDLLMIPARLAIALQEDGWYVRLDIIWNKTNPMPESVTDRPTKAHEYVYLLSRSPRYFYDAAAIAEPLASDRSSWGRHSKKDPGMAAVAPRPMFGPGRNGRDGTEFGNGVTRNKRSVWSIPTAPFPEAHFATFPPALIEPCVLAGCPVGGTVLDPFTGSGTTGEVAISNGRNFIGIELNPEYLEMARRRIGNTQPPLPLEA